MAKSKGGRPTIFGTKTERVQGGLTPIGSTAFEEARRRLAKIAGWEVEDVSDGETIDFLARGETATRQYLKQHA